MKKIYLWGISLFLLLLTSCSKEELMTYELSARSLYIPMEVVKTPASYSFRHHINVDDYEAHFPVKLNGQLLDEDKTYRVEVVKDKTTALPEDYTLALEQIFHAGVWEDYISVTLHKTAHLSDKEVCLTVTLVSNENFGLSEYIGDPDYNYNPAQSLTASINFSNKISRPEWWDTRITNLYLGAYSDTKYERFIESSGVADLTNYTSTEIRLMVLKFRDDINKNQWLDEDKKLMTVVAY